MKSRAAWKLRELFPPPAWEENGEQRSRLFLDRNTRATLGDESGGDGWDRDGPQGIQPSCPSTAAGTFTKTHTPRTLQTPTSPHGQSRCSDPSAPFCSPAWALPSAMPAAQAEDRAPRAGARAPPSHPSCSPSTQMAKSKCYDKVFLPNFHLNRITSL